MNFKTIVLSLVVGSSTLLLCNPTYLNSPEKYESHFSSHKPMITMYTSPSCGPCRQMKPDFYAASNTYSEITFCIVDINKPGMNDIARRLQIQSIPTLIFSCDGRIISRTRGQLSKRELDKEIAQFQTAVAGRGKDKKELTKKIAPKNSDNKAQKHHTKRK